MAGRIRSIKPEILEDERAARLPSLAWRLWVSMWLLADDHGRLRGTPAWLHSQVFWSDPGGIKVSQIESMLEVLSKSKLIHQYVVNEQYYIEIPNWKKHQKIDHPGKPKIPPPCDISSENTRDSRETLAKSSETLATDLDLERDQDQDQDQEKDPRLSKNEKGSLGKLAEEVLAEVSAARKRVDPTCRVLKPTDGSLKNILARLKAGATVEDCLHVVAVCEAESKADPKSFEWFNTVSPFLVDNFERKLAADPKRKQAEPRKLTNYSLPTAEFPKGAHVVKI